MTLEQPTPLPNTTLLAGRYAFARGLGQGSSGRVLLVHDTASDGALRAAKVVTARDANRLRWEFELLATVAHPSLARVYELLPVVGAVGEPFHLERECTVLIEEYARGDHALVAASRFPFDATRWSWALEVIRSTAEALAALHRRGLVHGDVKPENVLVSSEQIVKLIDLGLARPAGQSPFASGTLGYMAPEAWGGFLGPASDLYALGVTLYRLLGGPLESRSTRASSSLRTSSSIVPTPPVASDLPPSVPESLRRLVAWLLEPDAGRRPASARAVSARLAAVAGELGLSSRATDVGAGADSVPTDAERATAVAALPLVGRSDELDRALAALRNGGLLSVVGPAGVGRTRFGRQAVRTFQLELLKQGRRVPTHVHAVGEIPPLPSHDAVVYIEHADHVVIDELQACVRAASVHGHHLGVVLELTRSGEHPGVCVELGPLASADTEKLLRHALPETVSSELVQAAHASSGGLPGRLCRLLAEGLAAGMDVRHPAVWRELGSAGGSGPAPPIPLEGQPLAEALVVAGGALDAEDAAGVVGEMDRVQGLALLTSRGAATFDAKGRLSLRPDLAKSLAPTIDAKRRRAVGRDLLDRARDATVRAFARAAVGQTEEAASSFAAIVRQRCADGDPASGANLGRRALTEVGGGYEGLAAATAEALRAIGHYERALAVLGEPQESGGILLRADLLRILGRHNEAHRALDRMGTSAAGDGLSAQALRARLYVDEGRWPEARALAEKSLEAAVAQSDLATEARAAEAAALAALVLAGPSAAQGLAVRAVETGRRLGPGAEARGHALCAIVASARGEIRRAGAHHARAFALSNRAGERHATATNRVNMGLTHLEAGEPGPAIAAMRDGARRLAALGRDRDLCRVLYNLGLAAVSVGDDDLAASVLKQGITAAQRSGDPAAEAYTRVLEAELAMRARDLERAQQAAQLAVEAVGDSSGRDQAVVAARQALVLLRANDPAGASAALSVAQQGAARDESGLGRFEERLAAGALLLAQGDAEGAFQAACEARAAAEQVGTYEARLRLLLLLDDVAVARSDRAASERALSEARTLLDAAAATLEPDVRARFQAMPLYRRAFAAVPTGEGPRPATADGSSSRWRRLALAARRLTSERRVSRLYERVVDTALELTGAERALFVVRESDGTLQVRIARTLDGRDLARDDLPYSRSVVTRALEEGRSVSTFDALTDTKLETAASVHALSLRSVIAVPVRARGGVVGACYLDDRLRPSAFHAEDEALLSALADLASTALEGVELLRREQRQARRLGVLRRRLSRTVEAQALELASFRQATSPEPWAVPGFVAGSDAMQRVLALAQRAAAADVPVLIVGESGTGKELLARAIHKQSPRAQRPFIGENCAALPETLLESALFGHVRGAFTGADRSRPGLFEAADGGSLFLDEIGEMSPAMQTKLLRVLQEGEVRPVGSTRSRRVDVRILAATHRDLESMVEQGDLRQDLYYRLAVVQLPIPPLRERPGDVAPLVQHFFEKHGSGRVRVAKNALTALSNYSWPGNVRELENEVQRVLLVAQDTVRIEHLSPKVRGVGSEEEPDELDLKSQVQKLERRLIRQALAQTEGNQTQAAKLLGVSRYGLQKMLKRLEISVDDN